MIDEKIIVHEAEEYVNNNMTIKETADSLGISRKTLQLHFKRLKKIDENLYKRVEGKKALSQQKGRIKGGQIGKVKSKYTKKEADAIARTIINKSLSYKEAEDELGIPKSTIYEIVHSDLVSKSIRMELDILAEANIHDITTEELRRRKR